jgi:hypothetical protein
VYVASGPVFAAIDLVADAAWVFDGVHAEDRVGNDVIDAGDMNGDGIHDLALAASSGNGTVFVVDGGMTGGEYRIDLAASVAIEGPDRDSYFGDGLVTTDYDDDGTLDLVVGAFHAARDRGGVWGFLGPLSGTLDVGDADVTWLAGRDSGVAWLGRNMAAGDIDADGSTDLVLGAPLPGSVYLQFGLALGVVEVGTLPSIWGEDGDQLGTAVALVPDWTGDDGAEVFLGVPDRYVSGTFPGAFAVYFSERLY